MVAWCAELLRGRVAFDDPDAPSLVWLGGRHAEAELRRGDLIRRGQEYWVRTWAARALLYAWTPHAAASVVSALDDPAWRVREMAAKVARLRELGEAADALARLVSDETVRVRVIAVRALAVVGEAEHAGALHDAEDDPDVSVRRAARIALSELAHRIDRDV